LANQKTESFVYPWLPAHTMFDITVYPTFVKASDVNSSILLNGELQEPCVVSHSGWGEVPTWADGDRGHAPHGSVCVWPLQPEDWQAHGPAETAQGKHLVHLTRTFAYYKVIRTLILMYFGGKPWI